MKPQILIAVVGVLVAGGIVAGAGSACGDASSESQTESIPTVETEASAMPTAVGTRRFEADIWVDNWFAAYVDGELVREDSVSITTERSFNKETFVFEASYPFLFAVVAKDFKENDTGLEYIGTNRQQMGDGGFIGQIRDLETGEVVAVTGGDWRGLVTHVAPLNKDCEKDSEPSATCQFETTAEPEGWQLAGFDDADWIAATVHSEAAVSPKDGYDEVNWDSAANLIWSSDLETDNTILWRFLVNPY